MTRDETPAPRWLGAPSRHGSRRRQTSAHRADRQHVPLHASCRAAYAARMVAALLGVALIAVDIGGRYWLSRALKREGRPPRLAWTRVYISPFLWFGLVLV